MKRTASGEVFPSNPGAKEMRPSIVAAFPMGGCHGGSFKGEGDSANRSVVAEA